MNSPKQRRPRPAVRRWHVLCVLGLLAGLLGMHGLAPGGGLPRQTHARQLDALQTHSHARQSDAAHPHRAPVMPCGDHGDGHAQHADATCASGAVSGGPVVSPPVADPVPGGAGEAAVRANAVTDAEGARAPPTLAELQLLRI